MDLYSEVHVRGNARRAFILAAVALFWSLLTVFWFVSGGLDENPGPTEGELKLIRSGQYYGDMLLLFGPSIVTLAVGLFVKRDWIVTTTAVALMATVSVISYSLIS